MRSFFVSLVLVFAFLAFPKLVSAQSASLNSDVGYVIGESNCTKPVSEGGWGGQCKEGPPGLPGYNITGCRDFLSSSEEFVGICNLAGSFSGRYDCCVPQGTPAPETPLYENIYYSKSLCKRSFGKDSSGSYTGIGGSCTDTITSGLVTCEGNTVSAGYCGVFGATNLCCVPRDGEYVTDLCGQNPNAPGCLGISNVSADPLEYGEYTLLESLPGSDNTSGDLKTYLETLYRVALVLVVLGSIFMLTWGGFVYMTAAANTALINKAKGIIRDAIIGLLIALAAWLILYIINPNLVNLTLNGLSPVSAPLSSSSTGGRGGTAATCAGGLVSIPSGINVKSSAINQVCRDLAGKLTELKNATPGVSWRVTSTFDSDHSSSCHKPGTERTGNCVDIALTPNPGYDSADWDNLCRALSRISGLSFLNEASRSAACQNVSRFTNTEHATAAHLHINYVGN